MILKIIGAVAVLFAAFVFWRWTSVARGGKQRDARLLSRLDPIGQKIDAGEVVTPQDVADLAVRPEIRHMLFAVFRRMEKQDLLPLSYGSSIAQGEAALAYWMMHPNELQDAPAAIEFVETVKRTVDEREAEFHVYRYRMPEGHWAAKDGWVLGLAGPMDDSPEAYSSMPGAFSRAGDVDGKVKPAELVDWYVGMLRQKGMIK